MPDIGAGWVTDLACGQRCYAGLESDGIPRIETGAIALSIHFKLRIRAAIIGACSCSSISAAASSLSLIASNAKGSPFGFRLVNAYFLRSSSPKVMSSLPLQNSRNYRPELSLPWGLLCVGFGCTPIPVESQQRVRARDSGYIDRKCELLASRGSRSHQ